MSTRKQLLNEAFKRAQRLPDWPPKEGYTKPSYPIENSTPKDQSMRSDQVEKRAQATSTDCLKKRSRAVEVVALAGRRRCSTSEQYQ